MRTGITIYKTSWPTCDNVTISLLDLEREHSGIPTQVGIVELRIHKTGEHKDEAYIWNFHVDEEYRGQGYGRMLLGQAITAAKESGCKEATLEWRIEEAPKWVFD